jgi:hypothetical protein
MRCWTGSGKRPKANRPARGAGKCRKQLSLDLEKMLAAFDHYLALEGKPITRVIAEQRMLEKLTRSLTEDIAPLLPVGVRFNDEDAINDFESFWTALISRL